MLPYGAGAWTMNVEIIKRLAVFERKVLQKILGAVRVMISGEGDIMQS